ncbi:hypothetical protein NOVOSPHI9U_290011 [Novosphingobium sp. 9U]|nr:hypothetical protein NOVOSPHI9U_290011 [Novosphingobium sp. 9U]
MRDWSYPVSGWHAVQEALREEAERGVMAPATIRAVLTSCGWSGDDPGQLGRAYPRN